MLRFRWKRLLIPAALVGIMFVAPDDTLGQRGGFGGGGGGPPGGGGPGGGGFGGGGPGGGRGFNMGGMADSSFDRLVRSYGGSGDTLDYSKIPNDIREQSNAMAQRFGAPPLPTSGTISRTDFRAQTEQRMAARFGGSPSGAPPAAPGTTPTPGGDGKVVMLSPGGPTDGKTMTMTTSPGGPGMMPGGPGGPPGGGPSGWGGGGGMTAEGRFKEMDKNQDGKISKDEAANGSRRLAGAFDQNDTNKDGSIDMAEYTTYFNAAMGGMGGGGGGWGGGGGNSGWGGGGNSGWGGSREEKKLEEPDEPKPVVYRFGHLPGGLPAYFTDGDFDKDGQIGLYEWVKYWDSTTETKLAEFKALDTNGDGLLTAEEYIRVKKISVTPPGQPDQSRGRGSYPPAEGVAPVSPGAALEQQQKKDESSRDPSKELKKEEKKEEKREDKSRDSRGFGGGTDPRSSGGFGSRPSGDSRDPRGSGSDPRSGGFGSRPSGDSKSGGSGTPPAPGGGGNPFNPGGRGPGR